jgi:hypothetical protein
VRKENHPKIDELENHCGVIMPLETPHGLEVYFRKKNIEESWRCSVAMFILLWITVWWFGT